MEQADDPKTHAADRRPAGSATGTHTDDGSATGDYNFQSVGYKFQGDECAHREMLYMFTNEQVHKYLDHDTAFAIFSSLHNPNGFETNKTWKTMKDD